MKYLKSLMSAVAVLTLQSAACEDTTKEASPKEICTVTSVQESVGDIRAKSKTILERVEQVVTHGEEKGSAFGASRFEWKPSETEPTQIAQCYSIGKGMKCIYIRDASKIGFNQRVIVDQNKDGSSKIQFGEESCTQWFRDEKRGRGQHVACEYSGKRIERSADNTECSYHTYHGSVDSDDPAKYTESRTPEESICPVTQCDSLISEFEKRMSGILLNFHDAPDPHGG